MSKPRYARKERKREPKVSTRRALTPISSREGIAETGKAEKKKEKKRKKNEEKEKKEKTKKRE